MIFLTGKTDSYAQFITVLVIFVLVLAVTAFVTRWIANYQKQQNANLNVEVIETTQIGANKYIQIVRLGKTYKAIAVCKDTVTCLGEVPEEQLMKGKPAQGGSSSAFRFREIFDKAVRKAGVEPAETEDNQSDDEV